MSARNRKLAVSILLVCVTVTALIYLPLTPPVASENISFKFGWSVPVGSLTFPSFSRDGALILLPALFDGYYLYDSSGGLIQHLPDPYALLGDFSSDRNHLLLAREIGGRPSVSLVDRSTMSDVWNYSLDVIHYATVAGNRALIAGATSNPTGGFQELLLVRDVNGTVLLNLQLGLARFEYASLPAISGNGRYVAIGSWGQPQSKYWLYFRDLDSSAYWNVTLPSGVQYLAVSSDQSTVAAAGPQTLFLFDRSGKQLWSTTLPDFFAYLTANPFLRVSEDGHYVAVAGGGIKESGGYVLLFDRTGKKLWSYSTASAVSAFSMDSHASAIVVGDSSGLLYVLNRSGNLLLKRNLFSRVQSIAVSETTGTIVSVTETFMYVMDSPGNILWKHFELPFAGSDVDLSTDGRRIVAGNMLFLDQNGSRLSTVSLNGQPVASKLSADGIQLVVVSVMGSGSEQESVLSWFNVNSASLIRNVTLDKGLVAQTLSTSSDGSLAVVAGNLPGNYSFLYAFNSQGRKLWQHLAPIRTSVSSIARFDYSVAVSADGEYVAVGSRELDFYPSTRPLVAGNNNAVFLFNKDGAPLWNYTTDNWITSVTVSQHGEIIAAAGVSGILKFNNAGKLLWTQPADNGAIATSTNGLVFIAGDSSGVVFLGNSSGAHWHQNFNGHVENVAISDDGNISAAILATDVIQHGSLVKLLYILNGNGELFGNFTFTAAAGTNDRLAVAGNGCCVIASLQANGVYYYEASAQGTSTTTVQTTTTGTPMSVFIEIGLIGAGVAIVAGLAVALAIMRRKKKVTNH